MYDSGDDNVRVVCLGNIEELGPDPLVRVHSSCLASEVFGAIDCDCADQLRESMKMIAEEGRGLVIHLQQEGRGQGLSSKIQAIHRMQHDGIDTVEAYCTLGLEQDTREYAAVTRLLHRLDIHSVRLISNNPRKVCYLQERGIHVTRVNTHPVVRPENAQYLESKNAKLGHNLPLGVVDHSNGTIRFYHSDQPWGELSNFSNHAVFLRDRIWPSVEHFYQGQKFVDTVHEEAIRCCRSPILAKQHASELATESRRQDWPFVKEAVMLEGLRAKFRQHPDMRELLLRTGDRVLVEHSKNDGYWGDAGNGTGKNRLGHLLMHVRTELQRWTENKRRSD
jgi:GTP cyclohydrolase II